MCVLKIDDEEQIFGPAKNEQQLFYRLEGGRKGGRRERGRKEGRRERGRKKGRKGVRGIVFSYLHDKGRPDEDVEEEQHQHHAQA